MTFLPTPPTIWKEQFRAECMIILRHKYDEMCRSEFHFQQAPKDSLNRFLMERSMRFQSLRRDPLFPMCVQPLVGPSMFYEINEDIPVKLKPPIQFVKSVSVAMRHIQMYCQACKILIEQHGTGTLSREQIDHIYSRVQSATQFANSQGNSSLRECLKKLDELSSDCTPLMQQLLHQKINTVCKRMTQNAGQIALYLSAQNEETSSNHSQFNESETEFWFDNALTLQLQQTQLHISHDVLDHTPTIQHNLGDIVQITCGGSDVVFRLHIVRYFELKHMFQIQIHNMRFTEEKFAKSLWLVLRRYQTYFGLNPGEGMGMQGAIPRDVFQELKQSFGVSFECFASPLNCCFTQYCSAFHDTDMAFGSHGSFFDFYPTHGSFEVNPPFCEELMDYMLRHMEILLQNNVEPLSFIVIAPDWNTPPSRSVEEIWKSRFQRLVLILSPEEHSYLPGGQHASEKSKRMMSDRSDLYKPVHNSCITFLQNDAGFEKWGPTDDRINNLKKSWMHAFK